VSVNSFINLARLNSILLAVGGAATTVIVTPLLNYDPINVVKLLCLSAFAGPLLYFSLRMFYGSRIVSLKWNFPFWMAFCFVVSLFPALLFGETPTYTQIWGSWGRSTGLLAFVCLVIFFLASASLQNHQDIDFVMIVFHKLSLFIAFYTTVQYAGIDPIPWSQDLPVATLGNINFMSAFLGLSTITLLARLLDSQYSALTRIYWAVLAVWFALLIFQSGSIQGLLMTGIGALSLLFFRLRLFLLSLSKKLALASVSLVSLCFLALGGLGKGLLGSLLEQRTLKFRLDYWKAGVRITFDNPLYGVGIDGYGDYYRQYRDSAAVLDGPQRTSNTAHNIFLDISSGGGLFPLIFVVLLFTFVLIVGYKISKSSQGKLWQLNSAFSCFIGYLVFCLISINQLGVSVWGWIFAGLVLAYKRSFDLSEKKDSESKIRMGSQLRYKQFERRKSSLKISKDQKDLVKLDFVWIAKILSSSIIGTAAVLPAFMSDVDFLNAYRVKNVGMMLETVESEFSNDFVREKTLEYFFQRERNQEALELARFILLKNPRAFYALNVIRLIPQSTSQEKLQAIQMLRNIDPQNVTLQVEMNNQESQLRSR
jgi:O-antigen ligase